jgi:glucosylceramidase
MLYGVYFLLVMGALCSCSTPQRGSAENSNNEIEFWLTTGDKTSLLSKSNLNFATENLSQNIIEIDSSKQFQTMDGFGFSLTGGSAYLLHTRLDSEQRSVLLKELFLANDKGIGISYLRISIGASDLDDHVFSYADLSSDETDDPDLKSFSLDEDRKHLIPVLQEIIALNPKIRIMGSPWSAPAWMKTNNHVKGGSLKPEYFEAYAKYFVKYIQGMQNEGIVIDAVTIQNEPENPKNTPSMIMTAGEQAQFVKNNLGPAFRAAGIQTKIIVFDHNCDHPEYPMAIFDDPQAKQYIDGSAFHLYVGEVEALSKVHNAHPDRNVYFTEQWTSGEGDFSGDLQWHTKNLIIGATRNWSRNVLEWNLAADPNFNPHTDDGGCTICQGALTIGEDVKRNVSYYIIAHASKFVPAGSVRIESNLIDGISNVAFITPEGKKVLVAVNDTKSDKNFSVRSNGKTFKATLPNGSVGTFIW